MQVDLPDRVLDGLLARPRYTLRYTDTKTIVIFMMSRTPAAQALLGTLQARTLAWQPAKFDAPTHPIQAAAQRRCDAAVGQDVLGMRLAVFCGISRRQHDMCQDLITLDATYFVAEARVVRARACAGARACVCVCL